MSELHAVSESEETVRVYMSIGIEPVRLGDIAKSGAPRTDA